MGDTNKVNKSPVSLREGNVFLDGDLVADACKLSMVFTPKVWEGKTLGERGTNRRWLGYDITGTLEQWKTTPMYKKKILEYINTGKTPEFKIQGISDDKNSDYYINNGGNDVVTLIGCVLTGDIPLLELDTDGEVMKESVKFGAYNMV